MNIHRIHLKGPWEYRWLGDADDASVEPRRVKMPADWQSIFGNRAGTAIFSRRFHKPTGLEATDSVWLLFDGIGGTASVRLNGDELAEETCPAPAANSVAISFDITGRMNAANDIEVALTFDPATQSNVPGGLWGPVLIVIVSV